MGSPAKLSYTAKLVCVDTLLFGTDPCRLHQTDIDPGPGNTIYHALPVGPSDQLKHVSITCSTIASVPGSNIASSNSTTEAIATGEYMIQLLETGCFTAVSEELLQRIVEYSPSRLDNRLLLALLPPYTREINLTNCKERVTLMGLVEGLKHCPHIKNLNLQNCSQLLHADVFTLTGLMNEGLTTLVLEGNSNITDDIVWAAIKSLPNLMSLNISCCSSITDDVFLLDPILQLKRETSHQHTQGEYSYKLSSVDMSGISGISSVAVRHLCSLCGPNLRQVNLAWSTVDSTVLFYLAGYNFPTIIDLVLNREADLRKERELKEYLTELREIKELYLLKDQEDNKQDATVRENTLPETTQDDDSVPKNMVKDSVAGCEEDKSSKLTPACVDMFVKGSSQTFQVTDESQSEEGEKTLNPDDLRVKMETDGYLTLTENLDVLVDPYVASDSEDLELDMRDDSLINEACNDKQKPESLFKKKESVDHLAQEALQLAHRISKFINIAELTEKNAESTKKSSDFAEMCTENTETESMNNIRIAGDSNIDINRKSHEAAEINSRSINQEHNVKHGDDEARNINGRLIGIFDSDQGPNVCEVCSELNKHITESRLLMDKSQEQVTEQQEGLNDPDCAVGTRWSINSLSSNRDQDDEHVAKIYFVDDLDEDQICDTKEQSDDDGEIDPESTDLFDGHGNKYKENLNLLGTNCNETIGANGTVLETHANEFCDAKLSVLDTNSSGNIGAQNNVTELKDCVEPGVRSHKEIMGDSNPNESDKNGASVQSIFSSKTVRTELLKGSVDAERVHVPVSGIVDNKPIKPDLMDTCSFEEELENYIISCEEDLDAIYENKDSASRSSNKTMVPDLNDFDHALDTLDGASHKSLECAMEKKPDTHGDFLPKVTARESDKRDSDFHAGGVSNTLYDMSYKSLEANDSLDNLIQASNKSQECAMMDQKDVQGTIRSSTANNSNNSKTQNPFQESSKDKRYTVSDLSNKKQGSVDSSETQDTVPATSHSSTDSIQNKGHTSTDITLSSSLGAKSGLDCDDKRICDNMLAGQMVYKPGLVSLDITNIKFINKKLGQLCLKTFLMENKTLQKLELAWKGLTEEFLKEVLPNLQGLIEVSLEECTFLQNGGLAALLRQCQNLRSINLRGVVFIKDMAMSPLYTMEHLTKLNLAESEISDTTLFRLANRCSEKLTEFDLSWCEGVSEKGINYICLKCTQLKSLILRSCPVSNITLRVLASNCRLLTELIIDSVEGVGSHEFSDDGLLDVAENLLLLEILDISWNLSVTNIAVCALMSNLSQLKEAHMKGLKQITCTPFLPLISGVQDDQGDVKEFWVDEYCNNIQTAGCLKRSTAFAPNLNVLDLEYSDLVEDKRLELIVKVCRGSLEVTDYYGRQLVPDDSSSLVISSASVRI